jgi:hypothetical protein
MAKLKIDSQGIFRVPHELVLFYRKANNVVSISPISMQANVNHAKMLQISLRPSRLQRDYPLGLASRCMRA